MTNPRNAVRERLAKLLIAKANLDDPDGKIRAACEAGRRRFLEKGKLITGGEAKMRGYSLAEVKAFVSGFDDVRIAVHLSGDKWGTA